MLKLAEILYPGKHIKLNDSVGRNEDIYVEFDPLNKHNQMLDVIEFIAKHANKDSTQIHGLVYWLSIKNYDEVLKMALEIVDERD